MSDDTMPNSDYYTDPDGLGNTKMMLQRLRGRILQADMDLYRLRKFSTAEHVRLIEQELETCKMLVDHYTEREVRTPWAPEDSPDS